MNVKMVEVQWVDSMGVDGGDWASLEEHEKSLEQERYTIRSCGYLARETESAIMLAQSKHYDPDNDNLAGVLIIPKVAIQHTEPLQYKHD